MNEAHGFVRLDPPGFEEPLWVRPGDEASAEADAVIGQIRHNPRRILEINTGIGIRAIKLTRAFPEAEILSLATDLSTARLALLNTLPYPKVHFAILGKYGMDGLFRRLAERCWHSYDAVIVTAGPDVPALGPWSDSVRLIAIQGGEWAASAYPDDVYLARAAPGYLLFYRRVSANLPSPAPRQLFDPATPRPAPAEFATHCRGTRLLRTRLRAGPAAKRVVIYFFAEAEPETKLAEETLAAYEIRTIEAELPPWFGPCQIGFRIATEGRDAAGLDLLDAVLV